MKTKSFNDNDITCEWYLIDASHCVLGRLASAIAYYLRGKHKPEYTPHTNCSDHIVVVNAQHVRVTGNKKQQKKYYSHSGYPGGLKEMSYQDLMKRSPEKVIRHAVEGMLPRNPLGRQMAKRLSVYPSAEHPHSAQNPQMIPFDSMKSPMVSET